MGSYVEDVEHSDVLAVLGDELSRRDGQVLRHRLDFWLAHGSLSLGVALEDKDFVDDVCFHGLVRDLHQA